jgi:hypothetical protein
MQSLDEVRKAYSANARAFRVLYKETEGAKSLDEILDWYERQPAWKVGEGRVEVLR